MEHVDDVTSIFGGHAYPSPTNGIPTDVTDESFYSAYLKLIQATATRVRQRTGKRFVVILQQRSAQPSRHAVA